MKAEINNLLKFFHFEYLESTIICLRDTNRGLELTLDTEDVSLVYPWLPQCQFS